MTTRTLIGLVTAIVVAAIGCSDDDSNPSFSPDASGGAGGAGGAGPAACGNASCDEAESCVSCPEDCGICGEACGDAATLVDLDHADVGAGCDCDLSVYDYCQGQEIVETVDLRDGFTDAVFTWIFTSNGGDVHCGRFVNGDYWVAPQPRADVTLVAVESNGSDLGVDADPRDPEQAGVLDGDDAYGNYDPAEDLTTQLPLELSLPTSLVAARKKDEERDGGCGTSAIVGACIDVYDVVTVLETVPRNAGKNCIRPPVVGGASKMPRCLDTDFVLERIPTSPHLSTDAERLASVRETWRHALELFTNVSEGGRAFRVEGLTDDYASGNAAAFYGAMAAVFSDDVELADKQAAIGSLLAYGQDFYHGFVDPDGPRLNIPSGAGQSTGHASSAYLFTTLLMDPLPASHMAALALTPDDPSRPQEMKQVQVRGEGTEPVWGDGMGTLEATTIRYWAGVMGRQCYSGAPNTCDPNGGKKTVRDPYGFIDGPENQACASYWGVTKGPYQAFAGVQWTMPELCDVVSYDPFLRYVDRIFTTGCYTQPDPCAPPDPREDPATCHPWDAQSDDPTTWLAASGCGYYTVTWGPDPTDLTRCIPNNTGDNTGQSGRFVERHGTGADAGVFWTSAIREVWDELRGSGDTCRTRPADATIEAIDLEVSGGWIHVGAPSYDDGTSPADRNAVYEVVRTSGSSTERWVQSCGDLDVSGDPSGTGYTIRSCDHVGLCSPEVSHETP